MTEPRLPLKGIRVIDLTVVWAGPFSTVLLSDMGAEVIRVESLAHPDLNTRGQPILEGTRAATGGGYPDGEPGPRPWNRNSNFNTTGRNKKSVTMDVTKPEGHAAFLRLVQNCDVFIENNSPEVIDRLNITWDVLSQANPRLVMISMPGFGRTGPYSKFRAFGANMEAIVGHTTLRGYTDSDATGVTNVFLADAGGGAVGVFAILAALRYRQRTGKGQYIDMSQAENIGHFYSQAMMDYSMNGRVQGPMGNRHPSRAPQGVYRCAGDDTWLALSCGDDAEFAALCGVMGQPSLAAEPRFADSFTRYANQDALDPIITAWSAQQDQHAAFHALQAAGVPAGPVLTTAGVFNDPHLKARDMWQQVTLPEAGTHWYLKPTIGHMSRTPLKIWAPAPNMGADNEYVYQQVMGYTDAEYDAMVQAGHIGDTYDVVREHEARKAKAADV